MPCDTGGALVGYANSDYPTYHGWARFFSPAHCSTPPPPPTIAPLSTNSFVRRAMKRIPVNEDLWQVRKRSMNRSIRVKRILRCFV
ncbi:hypothetical protein M407DRAFT_245583 [Tulasnella calospora MUT 4182]|uniref:Uncharacterized protein n=1 Tax=Tulasnella calospora MUT 4182 TaxID=1051891 RepID=A0A0C3KHY8_9AGAM|nr:hypothetical protein M407DRAFT_245583 [Tulasnella calospora MUT 4182]